MKCLHEGAFLFWEAFRKHLPTSGQKEQLSCCLMHSHVHTHIHNHACCTIHNYSHKFTPCLIFLFRLYIMLLHTTREPLHQPSDNPSITVKQWTFHGSIRYGNKYSLEINGLLGSFHQSPSFRPVPPHYWKKEKKESQCYKAYLWICMHGNSCLELPKLRIT